MATIELLKAVGVYPTTIYITGVLGTGLLCIILMYYVFACLVAWLRK